MEYTTRRPVPSMMFTAKEKRERDQGILAEREGSIQLISLNSLVQISLFFILKNIILFTKEAILIRRSTVLSLPL
jgi:hypothetical protein